MKSLTRLQRPLWCRHPACILLIVLALLAPVTSSAPAAEKGFHDLSFDDAMKKAGKEKKLVFIDFYTTWCGPCKMMDRDTFSDEKVIKWLSDNAVALKVDAERNMPLAEKFNVSAYPTLVFLRPDGRVVGRVESYLPPELFLDEAEGALTGKDPLTRAKEKLDKEGKNNPMARLEYAEALFRHEKPADALENYLWCLDHGLEHDPQFKRVRLTYLMTSLAQLMQYHPPVRAEVQKRRDAAEKELRSNAGATDLAPEYHAYNQILRQSDKTRDLYNAMKKQHADWPALQRLLLAMLPEQLDKRAHDWHYQEMDLDAQIKAMIAEHDAEAAGIKADKKLDDAQRKETLENLKQYYAFRMTDLYQLAVGAGQPEAAAKLSEQILEFNNSAEVLRLLALSGYLTEQPIKANLDQAEKAYDMTGGKDASVVEIYVRLLVKFDEKDKAATILDKALRTVNDPQGKVMLLQCRQMLGIPSSG
jgi:thioredoxin-related protein